MATAKAEETRERILDAALRLFRERGFEQTTMRDVAAEAGVATGAAYYYYRSKQDLVMAFYLRTDEESREAFTQAIAASKELKKRLRGIIEAKFEQFAEHRSLLTTLLKTGVDPRDPLSPFGEETKQVRDDSIAWYERALAGSDVSIPKDVAPHLPRLLWMYHMGLIYHWLVDATPNQRRTAKVVEATLDLVVQLLRVSSLPFMGPLRKRALKVLRAFEEE
ncbi:MAG TPA: TetR/AcrR family transcriptional regulator [Thermoanaerobaculia bacterium]|nr:TetR/AcrR family transcriptional regulator [Thermoanaerobaculia bacterium]